MDKADIRKDPACEAGCGCGGKGLSLEEALEQVKGRNPVFEPLPQFDVPTASGKIYAGFLQVLEAEEGGAPQKLFCYLGIPDGAGTQNKAPGILLIHGGGGFAYPEWVEEWMKRGYAAVTVDNYGYMPREDGRYYNNADWPEQEPMYQGTPTGMVGKGFDLEHCGAPLRQQGMFHVVAANILAGNLLRVQDAVDADRIGVTGISWGGFTIGILIAYDQRFSFAVPVYGCACLSRGTGRFTYFTKRLHDPECARLWEAGGRLSLFKNPILWVNDTQDANFPPNCTTQCFLESVRGTICLKRDLAHYHKFDIEEIYDFADWAVRGGNGLPVFTQKADASYGRDYWLSTNLSADLPGGGPASMSVDLPGGASRELPASSEEACHAELYYLTEPVDYEWKDGVPRLIPQYRHLSLEVGPDGKVHVKVPQEAAAYFIELWRGGEMTSTPFVEFYAS